MLQVIYTSYTNTQDGLVLRNNWIDKYTNPSDAIEDLSKFKIDVSDWVFPSNCISNILVGTMGVPNVIIHCRIVTF